MTRLLLMDQIWLWFGVIVPMIVGLYLLWRLPH